MKKHLDELMAISFKMELKMKIEVSESTLKTIICSLENYLINCLDIDEDAAEMVVVARALGELQGTFKALKDNENREVRETNDENFRIY